MEENVSTVNVDTQCNTGKKSFKKATLAHIKRNRLLFYVIFMIFPVLHFSMFYVYVNLNNILLAFQTFKETAGGYIGKFSGLDNFKTVIEMLSSGRGKMIVNSLLLFAVNMLVVTPLAIIFSYYIYKKFPCSGFFKLMLFLPRVVSSVVLVLLFQYIVEDVYVELFKADYGLLTTNGFAVVMFYNVWVGFGINIMMYSGSMSGINESISESAQLDGANIVQEFWYITLPMIFPTITTFIVVGITTLFTDQMGLYTFFGENANFETVGYFLLIQSKYSDLVSPYPDTLSYSQISAFGLMITAIILPLTLTLRHLLEKYGPSAD